MIPTTRWLSSVVGSDPAAGFIPMWTNTGNVTISDTPVGFINQQAKVDSNGGADDDFTVRNPRTTNSFSGNWTLKLTNVTAGFFGGIAASGDAGNTFSDIDYAFWSNPADPGNIYVYEEGNIRTSQVHALSDILEIRNNNGIVSFYVNGTFLFTGLIPVIGNYILKFSLFDVATSVVVYDLTF